MARDWRDGGVGGEGLGPSPTWTCSSQVEFIYIDRDAPKAEHYMAIYLGNNASNQLPGTSNSLVLYWIIKSRSRTWKGSNSKSDYTDEAGRSVGALFHQKNLFMILPRDAISGNIARPYFPRLFAIRRPWWWVEADEAMEVNK